MSAAIISSNLSKFSTPARERQGFKLLLVSFSRNLKPNHLVLLALAAVVVPPPSSIHSDREKHQRGGDLRTPTINPRARGRCGVEPRLSSKPSRPHGVDPPSSSPPATPCEALSPPSHPHPRRSTPRPISSRPIRISFQRRSGWRMSIATGHENEELEAEFEVLLVIYLRTLELWVQGHIEPLDCKYHY